MSKVIFDGVNVAECKFIVNSIPADCDIDTCFCYENPNCYFKQLQSAKAENKQLKNDLIVKQIAFVAEQETNEAYEAHYAKLEAENERLKEEIKIQDNLAEHFRKEALYWAKKAEEIIKEAENEEK